VADTLPSDRRAPDGSPYPDRTRPSFQHDVRAMFTHIVQRYEGFDHVASLGNDYLWRPRALWDLERHRRGRPTSSVLDVGCGTGELTRLSRRRFPRARVIGVDFTRAMVAKAYAHEGALRHASDPAYLRGTALRLPFRDAQFDVAVSAFVARNLPSIPRAFAELRRVLAPEGTLLTLEITEPSPRFLRGLFHAYFDHVVPLLGAAVGSAGPYRYLPESLRYLPDRAGMLVLLSEAGFVQPRAVPQSGGIVTGYFAEAPPAATPDGRSG
jgi:demethylmenaquinone methyltransferase / 2-methoxy-6-polyprenyl-1,4-benzoquinol methylase